MAELVLYVVAEYPEVKHVAAYVHQPAVHEHRGNYGQGCRYGLVRVKAKDILRYRAVIVHYLLTSSG